MFKLQFAALEDVLNFMLDFSDVTGLTISRNANDDSLVQTFIFNSEFENIDNKVWWSHEKGEYISIDHAVKIVHDSEQECIQNCSFCESDKAHYAQMKDFFIEEIERIQFKSNLPFCSACGTDKQVVYIGLIPTNSSGILNFSFCVDCRNDLTLKKNAAIAAQERIGA